MISTLLLRVSVVLGLIGMTLGMVMGIREDFTLAPAHAHLNLVGFVVPFLAGLYYRAVPVTRPIYMSIPETSMDDRLQQALNA